jgi:hypothetical protein
VSGLVSAAKAVESDRATRPTLIDGCNRTTNLLLMIGLPAFVPLVYCFLLWTWLACAQPRKRQEYVATRRDKKSRGTTMSPLQSVVLAHLTGMSARRV